MLVSLNIRNVVLIEHLNLTFPAGLCVFTGETGAGKSILLDSLALALGSRMDSGLIRKGEKQASVTAEFSVPCDAECFTLLNEHGIEASDGTLFLRRIISEDGKSRAFINDEPVSVSFLKQIGEILLEVHGQFASYGLLDSSTHIDILDKYGKLESKVKACQNAFTKWKECKEELIKAREDAEKLQAEEDYLRHVYGELETLSPKSGEEEALANRRTLLMNSEKISENLESAYTALQGSAGAATGLRDAERSIERLSGISEDDDFTKIQEALARASIEFDEAANLIDSVRSRMVFDARELEEIEDRLFTLRDLARKHKTTPDALPELMESFAARLNSIDLADENIGALEAKEATDKADYQKKAEDLNLARISAANKLDKAVMKELPALKLEKASFFTVMEKLPETLWNPKGMDKVSFLVATNKGSDAAPLAKIASGGELSRFMLALKLNLAELDTVPALIFDEIDSGMGGAAATAIGERLARLSNKCQVMVVTHSPQVAAFADYHLFVAKSATAGGLTATQVKELSGEARKEEIARMLSGSRISDEARAAAGVLLESTWKKQAI